MRPEKRTRGDASDAREAYAVLRIWLYWKIDQIFMESRICEMRYVD